MSKVPLPAAPFLVNLREDEDAHPLWGDLRCPCGCETFRLRHNGRQAHPLLGRWCTNCIRPDRSPLVIDACCSECARVIVLHCTARNENGWLLPGDAMTEFVHPKLRDQRVRVGVWYCWNEGPSTEDGVYHTGYDMFSLGVWNDEHPKEIPIYENV